MIPIDISLYAQPRPIDKNKDNVIPNINENLYLSFDDSKKTQIGPQRNIIILIITATLLNIKSLSLAANTMCKTNNIPNKIQK
ncbi:MAG TPA: hypothetical protein D7I03_06255 [Candidatus Poseidoniales archaeon]|nr:MAG TPA: hypothetical protein D7I03_06255 [Candidatus Poseidoniales archaeon]|tara:strand:+ start:2709 stop:2957 length:249 start_codon:yes stop_codon:yes gene_type:complete